jgi:uncharacterized protein YggE
MVGRTETARQSRRIAALLALAIGAGSAVAWAEGPPAARPGPGVPWLEAVGEGTVTRPPDLAVVIIGVTTQAPGPRDAMDQNTRTSQAVSDALRALGLTGPDAVRTQAVSLMPMTEGPLPGQRPRIVGYQASNHVEVRVTQLPMVGVVLTAALGAGATDIVAQRFALADPRAAEISAVEEAVRDARARVEAMARALGQRVSRILEVRAVDGVPYPMGEMAVMARAGPAAVPVEPGLVTVRARVLLRAELQ